MLRKDQWGGARLHSCRCIENKASVGAQSIQFIIWTRYTIHPHIITQVLDVYTHTHTLGITLDAEVVLMPYGHSEHLRTSYTYTYTQTSSVCTLYYSVVVFIPCASLLLFAALPMPKSTY